MECTHKIFARGQINGGLAAHRGIHHGEQGRGYLYKRDAPLVDRGGKAAQIPHHAAAQGNQDVRAGQMLGGHVLQKSQEVFSALGGLSVRDHVARNAKARPLQGGGHVGGVQRLHRVVGQKQHAAGLDHGLYETTGIVTEARADAHVVGVGSAGGKVHANRACLLDGVMMGHGVLPL